MFETAHIAGSPATLISPVAEDLVRLCRETFGAALGAVVLTGSLARNEASYLLKDGRAILLSDAEAVVVLHDGAPLPSRQATQSLCGLAEQCLEARGVRIHVSLSVVHGSYLRRLPPCIYSYELRACGLVLYGEPGVLEQIPIYAASGLSREDAWRTLSNRLVEQMEADVEIGAGDALCYRSIKLCLDLASSLLVFFGRFEAGYRTRLSRMEEFALTPGAGQLPIPIAEFLALLRLCTTAKLQPEVVADPGAVLAEQITRWAWQAWLWELERMTGSDTGAGAEDMIGVFGRSLGGERLLRGWLFAVRRAGWLHSAPYWTKWLWLLTRKLTPRHAVYLAAYRWRQAQRQENCNGESQPMEAVRDLLPVDGTAQAATAAGVARQLVWNYQEFVMETRA
jgi:hypothetical protein